MSNTAIYAVPAPQQVTLPVVGHSEVFPIHRIYCVGRNYAEHAKEMGHSEREAPFFFMKPHDAALPVAANTQGQMPYPSLTQDLHHEVELVVAIGQGGSRIAIDQAMQHVYGYAVGLDMTRRDLQAQMKKAGRPWCIAKGFDHSAPIGSLRLAQDVPHIEQAAITLHVNDQLRQQGHISDLIWRIPEIIAELSHAWALQPGDLIFTGTPAGVGAVTAGDALLAQIDGLPPLSLHIGQA